MKKTLFFASFLTISFAGFSQSADQGNKKLDENQVVESEELRTNKEYQASKK